MKQSEHKDKKKKGVFNFIEEIKGSFERFIFLLFDVIVLAGLVVFVIKYIITGAL